MKETFRRLMHTPPGEWRRDDLRKLSADELRGLCELLGIPTSGTKPEAVERLLSLGGLRHLLHEYEGQEGVERLTADFDKRELKGMASMAKIWKSGTKRQLAAGLIQWRDACRFKGQENLRRAREELHSRPRQLPLPLYPAGYPMEVAA
ncbi:MAG TPA: SAP domain-containing protein [Pyrinomonadaceae bacterium]|jgi:hypothetical protein